MHQIQLNYNYYNLLFLSRIFLCVKNIRSIIQTIIAIQCLSIKDNSQKHFARILLNELAYDYYKLVLIHNIFFS